VSGRWCSKGRGAIYLASFDVVDSKLCEYSESYHDEVEKIIVGVFSSEDLAREAIEEAKKALTYRPDKIGESVIKECRVNERY
jgi:hypothetical protein